MHATEIKIYICFGETTDILKTNNYSSISTLDLETSV
jgi:hypothetical protein